jgi:hypothetical protein
MRLSIALHNHLPLMVLIKNVKNCKLLIGVLLGLNKFTPVSVANDQLLCFPEPFTPLNGFHEIRLSNHDVQLLLHHIHQQTVVITAKFVSSKIGANSN